MGAEGPRRPGPIQVSPALRARLHALRVYEAQDAVPELDLEALRAVEAALGVTLPPALVAIWCAQVPLLRDGWGVSLEGAVGRSGAARRLGAPGDFVAFAQALHDPGRFVGLRKGGGEAGALWAFEVGEGLSPLQLDAWLDEVVALAELGPEQLAPYSIGAESFCPTLALTRVPEGSSGRRVQHPKFGVGRVLREQGAGPSAKVQVRFDAAGIKVLQARFLDFLE